MAEPPTIVALLGGGRGVSAFNDIIATKDQDLQDIIQKLAIFRQHLYHDREGLLVLEAPASLRVEEAGFGYENRLGVKDRGLEEITEGVMAVGMGLYWKAIDAELVISGGKSEGVLGVVANRDGLIEFVDKCIKKRGVRSSGNGGVDNSEGNCTTVVSEDFEAHRETRFGLP